MQAQRAAEPPHGLARPPRTRGGFTLVELAALLIDLVLFLLFFLPLVNSIHTTRCGSRMLKDSFQIRGVLQGMVIWAQDNQGRYPLPSALDVGDFSVGAGGKAKDTTSNILSVLIYHGYAPTEMFVSPAEANGSVREYRDYEFDSPSAAVDPANALWDPAFHATPLAEHNIATRTNPADRANNSYAHSPVAGLRRPLWTPTWEADDAVLGNRGPYIERVSKKRAPGVEPIFAQDSNTLLFHGQADRWVGNVGYSDNHVELHTRMDPEGLEYLGADGTFWRDVLFYDEPDDPEGTNAYLGVWAATGAEPDDRVAWWD